MNQLYVVTYIHDEVLFWERHYSYVFVYFLSTENTHCWIDFVYKHLLCNVCCLLVCLL